MRRIQILCYKNHLKSSTFGPSLSREVGTSRAESLTPCRRLRRLLSSVMYSPRHAATMKPNPPKLAVVIMAGAYLGLSCSRKTLLATNPIKLASGTPTDVKASRWPSCAMLLLYHYSMILSAPRRFNFRVRTGTKEQGESVHLLTYGTKQDRRSRCPPCHHEGGVAATPNVSHQLLENNVVAFQKRRGFGYVDPT